MSLLENSNSVSPFEPSRLQNIHRRRPVLKRARTPYCPSEDSKRRRTSPTGAFSRLSLSPTTARGPVGEDDHVCQEVAPPPSASNNWPSTSLTLRRRRSSLARITDESSWPPGESCKEARMKTGYLAYELEPNRIVIESLSDRSSSPCPSLSAEESSDPPPEEGVLHVSPELLRQLSARDRDHRPAHLFFNSHPLISSQLDQPPNHQQLVLYRKPLWPPPPPEEPQIIEIEPPESPPGPLDQPQIVEIEPLESPPPDLISSTPSDSMDID